MNLNIFMVVFSFIGLAGVLFGLYFREVAETERYKSEKYQYQIQMLKNESEEMAERFESARKQAVEQMKQSENESKKILQTKIAPGCTAAIKFGKEQALRFAHMSK